MKGTITIHITVKKRKKTGLKSLIYMGKGGKYNGAAVPSRLGRGGQELVVQKVAGLGKIKGKMQ